MKPVIETIILQRISDKQNINQIFNRNCSFTVPYFFTFTAIVRHNSDLRTSGVSELLHLHGEYLLRTLTSPYYTSMLHMSPLRFHVLNSGQNLLSSITIILRESSYRNCYCLCLHNRITSRTTT